MTTVLKVIGDLLLPPGLLVVLLAVAAALLRPARGVDRASATRRKPRAVALVLVLVSAGLLLACSLEPVSRLLIRPLEDAYPPLAGEPRGARWIVVLGGGVVTGVPGREGSAALGEHSLQRVFSAWRVHRGTGLPIIVSGGRVWKGSQKEAESAIAARVLRELGVAAPEILLERDSRTTWENAAGVKRLFHPKRVVLVTSAWHMPRAVLSFRRQGIAVIPAPTDYLCDRSPYNLESFLPTGKSLKVSLTALREYLALAGYAVRPGTGGR